MLFVVTCIYVALYYIRPFEWVPGLIGKPILLVVGVVAVLALLLSWAGGKIRLFQYKSDIFVLGLTIAIVLSHIRHGYLGGVVTSFVSFFPTLVGYFLVAYALNSRKKINLFLLLLIGLTTFLGYEAYLQFTTGHAIGGLMPLYEHGGYNDDGVRQFITRTRWYGTFSDPNDLGLALVAVVPLLFERCYRRRWLLPIATLPIILFGIYSTNSRGAILALTAGIFSFLILRYRSLRGAIIGVFLAVVGMAIIPSRMADVSAGGESAHGRIEAWYEGFQMLKHNPFFGVGKGMFTDYNYLTAHNSYVLVFAELGFCGAVFFAGLFALPLLWAKTQLLNTDPPNLMDEESRSFTCALIGSLISVMCAMFFLSRSYILLPYMLVAVLVAFVNLPQKNKSENSFLDFVSVISWKQIIQITIVEIVFLNILVRFLL